MELIDIKDYENIVNYNFYIFLIISFLIFIILVILLYKILVKMKNKSKTPKMIAKEKLLSLDYNNSKHVAYAFSENARILIQNEAQEQLFLKIFENLQKYKYKKQVPSLSEDDKNDIKRFMELCHV